MTSRIIRSAYGGAREAARLRAIHEQETPTIERAAWDNHSSVEPRGISTARAESYRLSEPRSDLLIPGLAGVSSSEESAR